MLISIVYIPPISSIRFLAFSLPIIAETDELKYRDRRVSTRDVSGGMIINISTTIPVVPANCFIRDRLPVSADRDSDIDPPTSGM